MFPRHHWSLKASKSNKLSGPPIPNQIHGLIKNLHAELRRAGHLEYRASTKGDGMVVEHRRHDEYTFKDGGEEDGVLELGELMAEPALGGVPQEPLSVGWDAALVRSGSGKGSGGRRGGSGWEDERSEEIDGRREAEGEAEGEEKEDGGAGACVVGLRHRLIARITD